jgi:FAD/FMN-containing dehydrogenase
VDVLLPGGERVRANRTEHADLFHTIVNGLGLVGIVLGVTHDLLELGTPVRVRSTLERLPEPTGLAERLLVPPSRDPRSETVFSLVTLKDGQIRSVVTRSRYVNDEPLRTLMPHRKASVARVPVELAIHSWSGAGQRFWNFAYDRLIDETRPYVDELEGYTFLMDGNLRMHDSAARLGVPFHTAQQTFVIPSAGPDRLAPFLQRVRHMLEEERFEAALLDVLHLPEDENFALSSTRGLAGHALTLTFEGIHDVPTLARLRGRLVELTQELRRLGGRVHLTKNVFATRDDLQAMYGEGLEQLARVKQRYDPGGLLASDFSDRLFPGLGR